jgi:hypothetical protein
MPKVEREKLMSDKEELEENSRSRILEYYNLIGCSAWSNISYTW